MSYLYATFQVHTHKSSTEIIHILQKTISMCQYKQTLCNVPTAVKLGPMGNNLPQTSTSSSELYPSTKSVGTVSILLGILSPELGVRFRVCPPLHKTRTDMLTNQESDLRSQN